MGLSVVLIALLAQPAVTPQPSAADQYREFLKQAREETDRYAKSGAARGGDQDPRLRWAARLWELRNEHAAETVGGNAARESVRLLLEAGRIDDALLRIDSLPASDVAWRAGLLTQLREASVQKGDPAVFSGRAQRLLGATADSELRARIHFSIGRFHLASQGRTEAVAAFEAAIADAPTSEYGKRAAGEIHELRALNLGQPSPAFRARSLAGKQVSDADLRGHATVFVYWASW